MNRKMMISAIILVLSILTPLGRMAHAAAAGFNIAGTWVNVDPATRGLTKLVIFPSGSEFLVRGYGQCSPSDCDWGFTQLHPGGHSVSDAESDYAIATYDFGFKETTIMVHLEGDQLMVETYNVFKDGSGRKHYKSMALLKRL